MNAYIKSLREEGYTSLRDTHYDTYNNFPALGRKENNKTPDPDTTDLEDQANNDNHDDEFEKAGETADPNEKTQEEEFSLTDPVEPAETVQEERTPLTDPVEPDETTQEEETYPTDSEKPNYKTKMNSIFSLQYTKGFQAFWLGLQPVLALLCFSLK